MARAYVAIGSNIEPRLWHLRAAAASLRGLLRGFVLSTIRETDPEYVVEQPRFLNAVGVGDTELSPHRLLDLLQAIERRFGRRRDREQPKGPRTLDLDLLLYDQEIVRSGRLTLPHPGIAERDFVLVPLLELSPGLCSPVTGRPYSVRA